MLHALTHRKFICTMFFPFSSSSDQNFIGKWKEIWKEKIMDNHVNNYLYNEEGRLSKEAQSIVNSTTAAAITGIILGSISKAKEAAEKYKTENQATLYTNRVEAYRDMQYKVTISVLKGGISYAMKLGTLIFLFSSISTTFYIYCGKFNIISYTCSGAITGFIYRMNMGLKGAFASSLLASIMGTIYGTVTALILFVAGIKIDDLYIASNIPAVMRDEKIKEISRKLIDEEKTILKDMYEKKNMLQNIIENQEKIEK